MEADANDKISEHVNSNEKNDKLEKELREKLVQEPDTIIVCNELGCGVVPMDAFDRAWRDKVIQMQIPLFAPTTKGQWGLRFDSCLAQALELGRSGIRSSRCRLS